MASETTVTVECVGCKKQREIGAGETMSEPPTCPECLLPMLVVEVKVPEEAVEASCQVLEDEIAWSGSAMYESEVRQLLEAAAPAIRKQERRRIQEALLSEAALSAALEARGEATVGHPREEMREAMEAAFLAGGGLRCVTF